MTDTTRGAEGDAADQDEHLTVEDAGSTTDPADLVDDDASGGSSSSSSDADFSIGHVFDQTNGVIDGLDGDSDGTAESDVLDADQRGLEDPTIDDAEVRSDDDGVHDLHDPNP